MKLTRKHVIWLAVLLVATFFVVDGFVPPPSHEVHSAGAEPISVERYDGYFRDTSRLSWLPSPASMSLADIKCSTNLQGGCDPTDVVPGLKQSPHTLYVVWSGCVDWSGAGAVIPWQGYNVEWVTSSRTLLLHCYTAKPWLYFPSRVYGVIAINPGALLAVPTSAMGSGNISIEEDDRLEHLVGDQSTEYQLATATISG